VRATQRAFHTRAGLAVALVALSASIARGQEAPASEPTEVSFKAADGLEVSADLYLAHPPTAPLILLFHQANWSRGEYGQIAPRLVGMGFNAMAVDLRSGGMTLRVVNRTHTNAEAAGKKTRYVDSVPDMQAAIDYARAHHAKGRLILWGSSYSAALVLRLAAVAQNRIDAVLCFSPGEYFVRFGKPSDWIRRAASTLQQPVFITSARRERRQWKAIFDAIPSPKKRAYVPATVGEHGSRALWNRYRDAAGYWAAVEAFLGPLR